MWHSVNIFLTVIDLFRSYLYARGQRILKISFRAVFSPVFFSILVYSIILFLTSAYHLYADDLQIYIQSSLNDVSFTIDSAFNVILEFIIILESDQI